MELVYISDFTRIPDEKYADALRVNILYMIQQSLSGHLASALSSIDIVTCLYRHIMEPDDIYITSKGHDCAGLYAMLISRGDIPVEYLHNYRRLGGIYGHPEVKWNGIYANTGSLGMGISKAQGLAIARKKGRVYVLVGDGELQEGQNFEAIRNIVNRNLPVTIIIDDNRFQCDIATKATSPYYDIKNMIAAMGISTFTCPDAHDYRTLVEFFSSIKCIGNIPAVVFCHTTKGKGISFIEGTNKYHSGYMTDEEYDTAVAEILGRIGNLRCNFTYKNEKPLVEKTNELIEAYSEALLEVMKSKEDIYVLSADLAKDTGITEISRLYPERFLEFGISEQDMVSAASGLALAGKLPIVHSFSAFLCRRANEQIYNQTTEGTKVIYVGSLAGVIPPGPGLSHTCLNDVELMKTMEKMEVLIPKCKNDVKIALLYAIYHTEKNVYIRLNTMPTVEGMRE